MLVGAGNWSAVDGAFEAAGVALRLSLHRGKENSLLATSLIHSCCGKRFLIMVWCTEGGEVRQSYDAVGAGASDSEANNDHEELGELHVESCGCTRRILGCVSEWCLVLSDQRCLILKV